MTQYWLVVGTAKNWKTSFANRNIWGLKEFRELNALWNLLSEGDRILLYVSSPVSGIVGVGKVATKFRQTNPLWPEEIRQSSVLWPLRFEYEIEYCLSPELWESRAYKETNLQLITRMVFQCVPPAISEAARGHFQLPSESERRASATEPQDSLIQKGASPSHEMVKDQLAKIGQIQGFLAEKEYLIEGNRLDVVWRRVEKSVPTYAFEVQVGGDIYHALIKLKRAYELWNSRLFLAGSLEARPKFEELTAGTFYEIQNRVRYLEFGAVAELYRRKSDYKELETRMGIIQP